MALPNKEPRMEPINPMAHVASLALTILTGIALASCSLPANPGIQTPPAVNSVQTTPTELPGATPQTTPESIFTTIASAGPTAPLKPTPATAADPTAPQEGAALTSAPAFIEPGVYSSLEHGYYILYDDAGRVH